AQLYDHPYNRSFFLDSRVVKLISLSDLSNDELSVLKHSHRRGALYNDKWQGTTNSASNSGTEHSSRHLVVGLRTSAKRRRTHRALHRDNGECCRLRPDGQD